MRNKKLTIAVICSSVALFAAIALAALQYITVANWDFELGTLTGWTATSTSITASSDYSYDGSYSARFKDPTSAFSGRTLTGDIINLVTATGSSAPADDYAFTLSAYFYVANEAAAGEIEHTDMQFYVKWYDSSGKDLGKDTGLLAAFNLSAFETWHYVSAPDMAAPANAARAAIVIAVKETVNHNNDLYVDRIRFAYDDLPAYLKTLGLRTFNPSSNDALKVFFPYSTPAGKASACRIVFNLPRTPVTEQRVNVLIYDVKGRLVRAIVKGEAFLAQHYDYIWDGRDANQEFLPVGMYIISVEVADQDTGGSVKEQAVVAIGRKL